MSRTLKLFSRLPALAMVVVDLLVVFGLTGCFVVDALPGNKRPGGSRPAPIKIDPTSTPEPAPPPKTLEGERLLRRITLELTGSLPTAEQRATYAAEPKTLPDTIDDLAESAETARTLAEAHRMMWRINARLLPDVDRFALTNSTLATALTAATRVEIIGEPLAMVRKLLDDNRPYDELFKRNYTIAHSDVLSLWGYTEGAQVWSDEPYFTADFPDSRPAAGILTSQGFLAAFGSEGRSDGVSYAAAILGRVACVSLETTKAHDFTALTTDQLSGDLRALAKTETKCASCHAQFTKTAPGIAGYGRPTDLTTWLARDTASDTASGIYAGYAFTGTSALAELVGEDHRVKSCTVRNLISAFMHRPFSLTHDAVRFSLLLSEMKNNDNNLRRAAATLVKSEEFQWKPLTRSQPADLAKRASGLHFLSRRHFLGLIKQLAPSASFDLPEELDPGSEELAGTTFRMPGGTYFHHVNRLVRQLATAIINSELADGVEPSARVLLTGIPAGGAAGIDAAAVSTAIIAVYKFLTGVDISPDTTTQANLSGIFEAGGGAGTDATSRDAWRAVLIAIMLSPDFVTY